MRRATRAVTALAASLTLLTLTACGAVDPESENDTRSTTQQTVSGDITCANIGLELQSIGDDLSTAVEGAFTDPQGFVSELQELGDRVSNLTDSVSDPELGSRMDAVRTDFDELIASVSDGSALNDLSGLRTRVQELGDSLTAVSDYCRDVA